MLQFLFNFAKKLNNLNLATLLIAKFKDSIPSNTIY